MSYATKSKIIERKLNQSRKEDKYSKYDDVDGIILKRVPKLNSYQRAKNKVELSKLRQRMEILKDDD